MRKPKKYHYIYKTTCKVTGKFYVGMHSTDNLEDGYLGSGKRLWRSIRKHGKEKHEREILEFLADRSSLKAREKEIVNEQFLEDPMCMNLQIGGGGGWSSEDHRLKNLSALSKGGNAKLKDLWENNQEWSDEQREKRKNYWKDPNLALKMKQGLDWTGRIHTEETKQKMSQKAQQRTGDKNSQYGTCWITNGYINKKIKKTDELPDGWSYGRK
jgi:hypothetical protein